LQWGNAKGEPYTGNLYVRFDEGTEVVRPPPTLEVGALYGFVWLRKNKRDVKKEMGIKDKLSSIGSDIEKRDKNTQKLQEEIEIANPQQPHVATVLLLDTSGSMTDGNKINQLNEGLKIFKEEVSNDDLARKRVDLAVITFGDDANVICDFSSIEGFKLPRLKARGLTPIGDAILRAIELVEERKGMYKANGADYFRPWIFMVTDGAPTDMQLGDSMWNDVIKKVHDGETNKKFSFFAVGVEPANMELLKQIAPPNREPVKLNQAKFKEMFLWLSKSQIRVSASKVGDQAELPNPAGPKGWVEAYTSTE
jgi:uncharacterized protein YegL